MSRASAISILAFAACVSNAPTTSHVETFDLPGFNANRDLDVLFVVDASAAMAPYRSKVTSSAAAWINVMNTASGGLPNVHIGVVAADVAGRGELRAVPEITGQFISDQLAGDGITRTTNYTGTLAASLSAMLDVGASASATTQPLEVTTLTFDNPTSAGFIRRTANLLIVLVAAQDDASPHLVETYARTLAESKIDPAEALVAGIYADPAPRLDALLAAFPNRRTFTSIDAADLGPALVLVPEVVRDPPPVPCITHPLDLDPQTPGGPYDCSVTAVANSAGLVTETLVQPCFRQSNGCWTIDESSCPSGFATLQLRTFPLTGNRPHLKGECVVP
ncbi:MAG: hypothetical protein JWO36_2954 [Myxococcales bacterium]|nr:hypothetical protein [Myxococcales bacterium]